MYNFNFKLKILIPFCLRAKRNEILFFSMITLYLGPNVYNIMEI